MSEKRFVDTNIFIYTLFTVDPSKHVACRMLFEQAAQGAAKLWTTEFVIAELVWFLERRKMTWGKIVPVIQLLLKTKGLEIRKKDLIEEVLKSGKQIQDFIDGLNIKLAQHAGVQEGYSYDRGLEKWTGFKRLEPPEPTK